MPSKRRRVAREVALRALYEIEVGKQPVSEAIEHCLAETDLHEEAQRFVIDIVHGVLENLDRIDALIARYSKEWALERQACVDRNVMRIATYEILYCPNIPTAATINEAVELVKKYSTKESGRFVNGVLGALADELRPGGRSA